MHLVKFDAPPQRFEKNLWGLVSWSKSFNINSWFAYWILILRFYKKTKYLNNLQIWINQYCYTAVHTRCSKVNHSRDYSSGTLSSKKTWKTRRYCFFDQTRTLPRSQKNPKIFSLDFLFKLFGILSKSPISKPTYKKPSSVTQTRVYNHFIY